MKAIVYERYGPPSVLTTQERPKPSPRPNEILVSLRAVEATKTDCELRSFRFSVSWFALPLRLALGIFAPRRQVLGSYFSGVVVAVGNQVTRFSPGDAVFGCSKFRFGAYGEFLCVPEDYTLAPMPRNITFEEAAALPLGGLNALHFMRLANIRPGQKALIVGAGGSIGSYAVQIAKAMGAHVTAVDAGHKEAGLMAFGADRFIDYQTSAFWEQPETYDVVFNLVASLPFEHAVGVLAPGGRYLMGNPSFSDMMLTIWNNLWKKKARAAFTFANETQEELSTLKDWIEQGRIRSGLDRTLSISEAPQAHQLVEQEQRVGSIVLSHEV